MSASAVPPRRELESYRHGACMDGISVGRLPPCRPMCGRRAWKPETKPGRGSS
jgi:hypothetical protein